MGFLDNTTSNIILDAVLTDVGRQFLARNDGSFSIFSFALGDDEVDYGIIKKYGRTVGKEKIQKNTPIFEALTNQDYALKYRLVSINNQGLTYLPNINLVGATSYTLKISTGGSTAQNAAVRIQQSNGLGGAIDPDLQDTSFFVEMSNLFVQATASGRITLLSVDGKQRALYSCIGALDSNGNATLDFTLSPRTISAAMFNVYGVNGQITTYVKVTGNNSGAVAEFPVYITQ